MNTSKQYALKWQQTAFLARANHTKAGRESRALPGQLLRCLAAP